MQPAPELGVVQCDVGARGDREQDAGDGGQHECGDDGALDARERVHGVSPL